MSNTINSNLLLSSLQQKQREGGKDVLGKDDFMKILMTQLQNQDPLNPMQDKDFIAQMATFSTLEQITNLSKSMETFIESQAQNNLISYNQFVGKEITWHKLEESSEGKTEIKEGKGIVSSVRFKDNEVQFILQDGTALAPGNVSQVNHQDTNNGDNSLVNASGLIGRTVYWNEKETGSELHSAVKSVSQKDGSLWFHLENGEKIKEDSVWKIE
ncbi:flagellar hook assembly protein FlgD [Bacillus salacetis]|uniref:Basal-body rod modification protein FlgD n=1 Tax=Bacillus salacetis TaxID=2315464 RepID=A0A3A1R6U0_9BACI|nr:flagellar hook assembly protein FlgD [Bacillus salacetis]RIW36412.1 flagellar hook assembly protein FlgD [Bacillus salacetis]